MANIYNQSQLPHDHQAQGLDESMNTPTFVDAVDAEVGKTETKDKSLFGFLKKADHKAESEPEKNPAAYTTDGGVEDESNLSDEEVEEEGGEKKKKRGLRRKIKDLFHGRKPEKEEKNPETEILDKEVEVSPDKPAKYMEASDDQVELNKDIMDGITEKAPVSKEPENTEDLHSTLPPIADETHTKEVEVFHTKPTEFMEASADQAELKNDLNDEITKKVPVSEGSENSEDTPSTLPPITGETHIKEVEVAHSKPTEFTVTSANQAELKHELMDEITKKVPISEESGNTEDTPFTLPPITGETHTKEVEVSHTKPTEFTTEASEEQAELKHDLMDEITEKIPISEESRNTEDTFSTLPSITSETHTKEVEIAHTKPTEFTEASVEQAELKHDLMDEITEKVPISKESENTEDTPSTLPPITDETHSKEAKVAHAKLTEFTEASADQRELNHDFTDEQTDKFPISNEPENFEDAPSTQLETTEHVDSSADKAELGKDEIKENLLVSKGPESTTVAPSTPPPITDETHTQEPEKGFFGKMMDSLPGYNTKAAEK